MQSFNALTPPTHSATDRQKTNDLTFSGLQTPALANLQNGSPSEHTQPTYESLSDFLGAPTSKGRGTGFCASLLGTTFARP